MIKSEGGRSRQRRFEIEIGPKQGMIAFGSFEIEDAREMGSVVVR